MATGFGIGAAGDGDDDAPIVVEGLRKSYGDHEAVRGIDLTVRRGEVVAFLGPNGAGKTTTVEILEGYRQPSAGRVRVLGFDPASRQPELRSRIGIVLQESGLIPYLTVRETVDAFGRMYPNPLDTDDALARVGLEYRSKVLVKDLSGGESRRLDLALGTIGRPELLFLDEPTTGFDPAARRSAWSLIRGLVDDGTTVFLTTHYLEEARALADRVIVISQGLIVAQGSPDELQAQFGGRARIRFLMPVNLSARLLPQFGPMTEVLIGDRHVEIVSPQVTRALHILAGWAVGRGHELEGLSVDRPTLEDAYLAIVGADPPAESS